MEEKRFYKLVDERLSKITSTLASKGNEYSTPGNKLHNFDRGANITGQTREIVLLGFLLKHQISILDIIDKIEVGVLPTRKLLDEKLTDIINYYILLEASIVDRIEKENV